MWWLVGITMATVLVNAGLTTFDKILAMNARDLELVGYISLNHLWWPSIRGIYLTVFTWRQHVDPCLSYNSGIPPPVCHSQWWRQLFVSGEAKEGGGQDMYEEGHTVFTSHPNYPLLLFTFRFLSSILYGAESMKVEELHLVLSLNTFLYSFSSSDVWGAL